MARQTRSGDSPADAIPLCLGLQIFGSRMPVYAKRFRNRISCFARCSPPIDLMAQFGRELRPTDLDALYR